MKRTLLIAFALLTLTSCNYLTRIQDSEITAIRDQTEVLKGQNKILQEISDKMDRR